MTDAERVLWSSLRRRQLNGFRFRRQYPVGPYVADFACPEMRLVIEVDGSQHGSPTDLTRDAWMRHNGLRVARFWNNDVLNRTTEVLTAIDAMLSSDSRATSLPPAHCCAFSPVTAKQGKEKRSRVR